MSAHIVMDVGDSVLVGDVTFPGRTMSIHLNELELRVDANCAIDVERVLCHLIEGVRNYIGAVSRQTAMGADLGWKAPEL